MRIFFWIFLILLVIVRLVTTRPDYQDGDLVRITTRVSTEPIRYETSQRLVLAGLVVYLPKFPEVYYGDNVVIEGVVKKKKLDNPQLISISEGRGALYQIRKKLINVYYKSIGEPHSALIAGVTIGSKAGISNKFWESLKKTGTAHVVVASGMNVTLVAGFLMNLLIIFMSRRKAIILALIGIWGYSVISGFDAPIVRAAIMGSIAFSAQALGRLNDAWRGLFLSALVMLIIKVEWIVDLGFILSFVATASMMLFEKKIRKRVAFLPSVIRENFSTSLAAQIGVAPIIYATFGQFNILSPVINALVLWTIAPITMIGMVGGIVSLLSIPLGKMILLLSYPLTSWFVWIVELFS